MGFLDFLAKRPSMPRDDALLELRAQAYEATQPALPPACGNSPVVGNGPHALEDLQRAAKKRSMAQLSASGAAPAPLVPRLRSHSMGRPTSAATDTGNMAGRSRVKSPHRSARDFMRRHSLSRSSDRDSSQARSDAGFDYPPELPPVPAIPDQHRHGARAISAAPYGQRSAYVDILDAQSGFKPSDFHSRLQASGARNYGEDVAERNIGINCTDLSSPAAKAFYALTGGAALAFRSDGSAVDVNGNMYQPGTIPKNLREAEPEPHKVDSKLYRDGPLDSKPWETADRGRPTSSTGHTRRDLDRQLDIVVDVGNQNAKIRNRRSTLVTPSVTAYSSATTKLRPLSMMPYSLPFEVDDQAPPPEIPRTRPGTANSHEARKPPTSSAAMSVENSRPSTGSRYGLRSRDSRAKTGSPSPSRRQRSTSTGKRASYRLGVYAEGDSTDSDYSSSSETVDRQRAGRDQALKPREQASHRKQRSRTSTHSTIQKSQHPVACDKPLPPRPSTSTTPSSSSQPSHPRSKSLGGSSGRPKLDDIIEHIPVRTSSLVPFHVPALTPTSTVSGYSSNMLSHRNGHNTANTSLDSSYDTAGLKGRHSRNTSGGGGHTDGQRSRAHTMERAQAKASSDAKKKISSAYAAASKLQLDEYESSTEGSDYDSFAEDRPPKRADPPLLQFKDGAYGGSAGGLPGLPMDDVGVFGPPSPMWGVSSGMAEAAAGKSKSRGAAPAMTTGHGAGKASNGHPYYSPSEPDSEFLSSDGEYEEVLRHIPTHTLAALVADVEKQKAAHRPSAMSGRDLCDLLDDMPGITKADVRTAVELRKAMKRQKRNDASIGVAGDRGERLERSEKSRGKMTVREELY